MIETTFAVRDQIAFNLLNITKEDFNPVLNPQSEFKIISDFKVQLHDAINSRPLYTPSFLSQHKIMASDDKEKLQKEMEYNERQKELEDHIRQKVLDTIDTNLPLREAIYNSIVICKTFSNFNVLNPSVPKIELHDIESKENIFKITLRVNNCKADTMMIPLDGSSGPTMMERMRTSFGLQEKPKVSFDVFYTNGSVSYENEQTINLNQLSINIRDETTMYTLKSLLEILVYFENYSQKVTLSTVDDTSVFNFLTLEDKTLVVAVPSENFDIKFR